MKYFLIAIVAFYLTSANSQEKNSVNVITEGLNLGKEFSFQNKTILFKKVISDSRCPINVNCIWAGEAKILIGILEDGIEVEEKIVSLKNGSNIESKENSNELILQFSNSESHYLLNALNLYPYPKVNHKTEASDYCLEIQLKESS